MGSMVSGLADAVLGAAEGAGVVGRHGRSLRQVLRGGRGVLRPQGFDALSGSVVDEFAACQQERARHGEIGRNRRNALVKTARMMLEFQRTGRVTWQMMSPDPGLSESSGEVLEQFAAAAGQEVAPGSVRLLAGEVRHFLAYLDRAGRGSLGAVTVDNSGGSWSRWHPGGLRASATWCGRSRGSSPSSTPPGSATSASTACSRMPRRGGRGLCRALPVRKPAVSLKGSRPGHPAGRGTTRWSCSRSRPGCAAANIVALRLDEIDWHRDEIRLVQAKTSKPLVLPLPAPAGNAVAEWILHGRPDCDAPEVFVRLKAPLVKLGNSTGSTLMRRRLARVLNGAEDSHGSGVFAAFIVPTGDGGEVAWSAAAPRR